MKTYIKDARFWVVTVLLALGVMGEFTHPAKAQEGRNGLTVTQGTPGALPWKTCIVDGSNNCITPTLDQTNGTAPGNWSLVPGPAMMAHGSASAPSANSADAATVLWTTLSGSLHVTSDSGEVSTIPPSAITNTSRAFYLATTASTNATNVKNAAGNVLAFLPLNNTATVYYLRWYNTSGTPTCSSATGYLGSMPIPNNTNNGAGIAFSIPGGWGDFSNGISYCVTGGSSSTDNTNAATGLFIWTWFK